MTPLKSSSIRAKRILTSFAALLLFVSSEVRGEDPVIIRGFVEARTDDCLNPANHNHPPLFFVRDEKTGKKFRITGKDDELLRAHPRQKVRIDGIRKDRTTKRKGKTPQAAHFRDALEGTEESIEIQGFDILPLEEAAEMPPSPVAEGANTLTLLSTLLVFISTDTNACMTSETNARNRLFDNPTNANEGMQAITKGRYGLRLGNGTGSPTDHVIHLRLNVNSANHDASSIEDLALEKLFNSASLGGMGLNRTNWNRILLFAPSGITNQGFTAYAYLPWGLYFKDGMVSMYGSSYGNSRMNGYLHELGHNFGFGHSSKGSSEYGDRTCVMGTSSDGTRTETYNAVKLLQTDWLNAFPNAKVSVTTDTTINLSPLSSDPNTVNQTIAVDFPGTNYYAAYHRDQQPYGFLSQAGDKDKLFVYTRDSGSYAKSFQTVNISVGGSYTGPGKVHFERYGPNMEYATVSFDMNDGNAKPVAVSQSLQVIINTPENIVLNATDGDADPLNFVIVTAPTKGVLSGTIPNLTYTPNPNYKGSDFLEFEVDDGKISSFAKINFTVSEPNLAPIVSAGSDQSATIGLTSRAPGWDYAPWTDDATSGLLAGSSYLVAHSFGNTNPSGLTVGGVGFTESFATSGSGWSLGGSLANTSDTSVNITGESLALARQFIYNGSPRTLTFSGLTVGETYEAIIYSVAWETGDRIQTFSSPSAGTSIINQSIYNNNNGIRIRCIYRASSQSETISITPNVGGSFHLYAMTNRRLAPENAAVVNLAGVVTDENVGDTLSINWSMVNGPGTVFFERPSAASTTAYFPQPGIYTLRLSANDGTVEVSDDVIVTVEGGFQNWVGEAGTIESDSNGDGVPNGIAWLLGASSPDADASSLLPTMTQNADPNYVTFTYRRISSLMPSASVSVQYSDNLKDWVDAVANGSSIIISETSDFYGTGVDRVQVTLSKSISSGEKLFSRLNLVISP